MLAFLRLSGQTAEQPQILEVSIQSNSELFKGAELKTMTWCAWKFNLEIQTVQQLSVTTTAPLPASFLYKNTYHSVGLLWIVKTLFSLIV